MRYICIYKRYWKDNNTINGFFDGYNIYFKDFKIKIDTLLITITISKDTNHKMTAQSIKEQNIKDQLYILIDIDGMFYDNDVNNEEKYILVEDELHDKIDNHVSEMCKKRIKRIVSTYGFFEAIKLHQDNYGEFIIDEKMRFMKTYGTLCYTIIDNFINDNDLVVIE